MISTTEFALRLLVGGGLGAAIGFERQWRQRGAGLHTSSLVAIGSALFALLSPILGSDSETRILANIVTGVGFLAGGVILRQGTTISGLNTAATIWSTAAVGALAGVGQFAHATMGAAAIIAFNLALQPFAEAIDSRAIVHAETKGGKTYHLTVTCDEAAVGDVRAAILDAVKSTKLNLHSISVEPSDHGQQVRADLRLAHRDDAVIDGLSATLQRRPDVRDVKWRTVDE